LQSETDVEKKSVYHGVDALFQAGREAADFFKQKAKDILDAFKKPKSKELREIQT